MRIRNWDVALITWATSVIGQPFKWGQTDCASLVRTACEVMYAADLFPDVGRYDTHAGAMRALAYTGGVRQSLRLVGATIQDVKYAQTGDIVLGPGHAGEPTESAFVVIGKVMLVTNMGMRVDLAPVSAAMPGSDVMRLPR